MELEKLFSGKKWCILAQIQLLVAILIDNLF